MDTWNAKTVKRQVDEVITESYLLCLDEREVRSYLKHFLDTCETVLSDASEGKNTLRLATIRIAMFKASLLLSEHSLAVTRQPDGEDTNTGTTDADMMRFVEQVASARSLILRLLEEYDSSLFKAVIDKNLKQKRLRRDTSFLSPDHGESIGQNIKSGLIVMLLLGTGICIGLIFLAVSLSIIHFIH